MPPKPHRAIIDRVSGYADEAAAYLRRRRLTRRPFARVYVAGGARRSPAAPRPSEGRALFLAASRLIDAARAERAARRRPSTWSSPSSPSGSSPARSPTAATSPSSSARTAPGFSLSIDESRIERAQRGTDRGAGVRVIAGETTYFAHVDGLAEADLERAADAAAAALSRRSRASPQALDAAAPVAGQEIESRPAEVAAERKAELLRACDERARARRRRGRPGPGRLLRGAPADHGRQLRRAASPPTTAPGCGSGSRSSPARDDTVETGFETLGGHRGFELVDGRRRRGGSPSEAAKAALTLLDADPAPAGAMPVVVGGGFGGVLFHEMTGHGLEADHIQKGASVYAGQARRGRSRQPFLRAYDDGRLPGEWGTDGDRRRGHPDPDDAGDRRGPDHLLPLRPAARRARTASTRPATAAARAFATCRSRG